MASLATEPIAEVVFTLGNRFAAYECELDFQEKLRSVFSYRVPGADFSPAYRMGEWDGRRCLATRGRVSTGLFLEMRKELEKRFVVTVKDNRRSPKFRTVEESAGDRSYQTQAVDAMIGASKTGGIVLAATGVGKTRLAAMYCQRLIGTVCFVCDELTLLEQSRIAIESFLQEKVGVVGRSEFCPERISVATIQTLTKHKDKRPFRKWFKSLDVLIIDEIHVALNKRNLDVITRIKPTAVFGLTATLQMEKPHVRLPATALAGPVIFTYPIQDGVEQGYLSKGVICCLEFQDTLQGKAPGYFSTMALSGGGTTKIWIESGSQEAEYRYRIVLNRARNDCVEKVVREGIRQGRKIVVLVERVNHLAVLSKRFDNIPHQVLSGKIHSDIRFQAMKDMDTGKLPLILASRVFIKGVDLKSVDMIVDATALPGRNSAIQRYGRGVRQCEGKNILLYVDISDTGRFAFTAKQRRAALRETGALVVDRKWDGNASMLLLIATLPR